MEFNTLEIIGLAFLSGLKIAELAEDVLEEDNKEDKNEKIEKEEDNIKTGIVKIEGEKATEFIKFIEKLTNGGKE